MWISGCAARRTRRTRRAAKLTWFTAIGRLKAGVTLAQARANLATVQADLGRQFPKTDAEMRAGVEPLKEVTVGGVRRSLWILFGSVSLLLLIACTNIAALLLSRAAGRQHEIAVRFSLGASRASVAAQLLTEVLVLALAGAAVGLLVAAGTSRVFRALAKDLPRIEEIGLDWRIVLYSLACAVAATLLCGLVSGDPRHAPRSGGLAGAGGPLAGVGAQSRAVRAGGRAGGAGGDPAGRRGPAAAQFSGTGPCVSAASIRTTCSPSTSAASWGETADQKAAKQRTDRILDGCVPCPGVEARPPPWLPGVPAQLSRWS